MFRCNLQLATTSDHQVPISILLRPAESLNEVRVSAVFVFSLVWIDKKNTYNMAVVASFVIRVALNRSLFLFSISITVLNHARVFFLPVNGNWYCMIFGDDR